jgi:hypothetical protein
VEEHFMTIPEFEDTLRSLMRRRPYFPFEIELVDGERLWIDRPEAVCFDGGAGAFIAEDGSLHFFNSETVRRIGEAHSGVTA